MRFKEGGSVGDKQSALRAGASVSPQRRIAEAGDGEARFQGEALSDDRKAALLAAQWEGLVQGLDFLGAQVQVCGSGVLLDVGGG